MGKSLISRIEGKTVDQIIVDDIDLNDASIGIDYGNDLADATVLTLDILKEAVNSLEKSNRPLFTCTIYPSQLHWFKYGRDGETTNSKKKFRHRNYDKAWRRMYHV